MRQVALAGLAFLSACGPRINPERGPVILSCEGEEVNHAANGETVREHKHAFYRVDGRQHTLEIWNDAAASFGPAFSGLTISPTTMTYEFLPTTLEGLISTRAIIFDRSAGRVKEEFDVGNGGTIVFDANCTAVEDIASVRKF